MNKFHAVMKVLSSSVMKKFMIALTGAFLVFFLCVHFIGNLLFFSGPSALNAYSRFLHTPYILYPIESILVLCFLYHAIVTIYVKYMNWRGARERGYAISKKSAGSRKNFTSALAPYTGVALLIFVVIHVWTMKFGEPIPAAERDIWEYTREMFSSPIVVALYMIAMFLLGLHLFNGLGTLYESIGIAHRTVLRRIGQVFAILLAGAFFFLPVAIYIVGGRW